MCHASWGVSIYSVGLMSVQQSQGFQVDEELSLGGMCDACGTKINILGRKVSVF